jgi:hypothetical protein
MARRGIAAPIRPPAFSACRAGNPKVQEPDLIVNSSPTATVLVPFAEARRG